MASPRCAVVYLARQVDGLLFLPRFLGSLKKYPAGMEYDLIVILKGYNDGDIPRCLRGFRADGLKRVHTMVFDDSRFATEAFFVAAERFEFETFLFFVSSARVLGRDWVGSIVAPLLASKAQLTGASSGFEALNETTPFPNPSIRTTGFAIRRKDWLALERGDLSVRYGGNLFEAGPQSMTKQILRSGGEILLVGRDGRHFPLEAWKESATFRLSDQENLLSADTRTDDFDVALPAKRKRLAKLNWGQDVEVVAVPRYKVYLRRFRNRISRLFWRLAGQWII